MKRYEHKEETPLAFYKFFMYVFLPLGTVSCIYSIVSYIFIRKLYSFYAAWYLEILTVQGIFLLVLYGFMFFGMLKWKKYTVALFVVLLCFCCVSSAISIVYNTTAPMAMMNYSGIPNFQMSAEFSALMETMNKVIVIFVSVVNVGLYILMFLYFYKRRLLFDGVPYKIPPKNLQAYQPQCYHYPPQNCPNCGAIRPTPEYLFCPECGVRFG